MRHKKTEYKKHPRCLGLKSILKVFIMTTLLSISLHTLPSYIMNLVSNLWTKYCLFDSGSPTRVSLYYESLIV